MYRVLPDHTRFCALEARTTLNVMEGSERRDQKVSFYCFECSVTGVVVLTYKHGIKHISTGWRDGETEGKQISKTVKETREGEREGDRERERGQRERD